MTDQAPVLGSTGGVSVSTAPPPAAGAIVIETVESSPGAVPAVPAKVGVACTQAAVELLRAGVPSESAGRV